MKRIVASVLLFAFLFVGIAYCIADHHSDAWNYGRCTECGKSWKLKTLYADTPHYEYWCENGHAFSTDTFRGWTYER